LSGDVDLFVPQFPPNLDSFYGRINQAQIDRAAGRHDFSCDCLPRVFQELWDVHGLWVRNFFGNEWTTTSRHEASHAHLSATLLNSVLQMPPLKARGSTARENQALGH
jgi:hypothetical protein